MQGDAEDGDPGQTPPDVAQVGLQSDLLMMPFSPQPGVIVKGFSNALASGPTSPANLQLSPKNPDSLDPYDQVRLQLL